MISKWAHLGDSHRGVTLPFTKFIEPIEKYVTNFMAPSNKFVLMYF